MQRNLLLIFFIFIVLCPAQSNGQIGKFFKETTQKAKEKIKEIDTKESFDKVKDATINKLSDKLNEERAEMDSASFSYAISVNDNADFVETDGFKENFIKWSSNLANRTDADEKENARALIDIGELAYAKGYYKKAENSFTKARTKYETNDLTDDPNYSRVVANIGLLYSTMGRYNKAEEITLEALKMRQESFGKEHSSYGASLNNLSVLQKEMGRYNEAEENIKKAVNNLEKWTEVDEMPLAIALNNEAMLYQTMGRYDQAEEILTKAIEISERNQGKRSGNHQKFLTNMALLQQEMGNYEKAEEMFRRLINIKKRRFGTNSPDYAHVVSNQAELYMEMEKYDKVEAKLKEAMEIYEKKFGANHRLYAKAASDLGNFYRFQGKYEEARPLLVEAKSIRKMQLGEEHPEYVQSLEDMAILNWKENKIGEANELYSEALVKSLSFINSYFPPMSEAEKTKYWDKLRPRFERFYAFVGDVADQKPALVGEMYDYHIATKGLLLNATNKIKQKILKSGDRSLINQYLQWLDQKETLASFYSYSKDELEEQGINLDSMERVTNANEKSLSARSDLFKDGYTLKQVSYQEVKNKLKAGDAAMEVVRVRKFDNALTSEVQYLALTLKPSFSLPALTLVQNGSQLETRYFQYYNNAIHQKVQDDYSYDQYWAPLATQLAGSSNIYLSLDGIYNQININTLRTPTGSYVIDQYNLSFIGNTKELVLKPTAATTRKTALLVGSPDFGGSAVNPLPGTKVEVNRISKVLTNRGYRVAKETDQEATEKQLKSVSNPRILHIATHGYFLEDNQLGKGKVFGVNAESAKNNPLLRAGLLLAGASKVVDQQAASSLENSNNGILTAYEAMNLNLSNTDLVVLSACETAVGDVKAGEGVYGLQRAFFAAGAHTMIMSLWKVDDAATQELMTSFYDSWLRYGNKKTAFKKAQLALKSKYNEPYYWGAFVLIGE